MPIGIEDVQICKERLKVYRQACTARLRVLSRNQIFGPFAVLELFRFVPEKKKANRFVRVVVSSPGMTESKKV